MKNFYRAGIESTGFVVRGVCTLCFLISFCAGAQSRFSPPAPPPDPKCIDTPVASADGSTNETLPVHKLISNHLARFKSGTKFTCSSSQFSYDGRREEKSIVITSRHLSSGAIHAELSMTDERNIGGYRPHGAIKIFWPNGRLQAREFYCFGFPVGFHRYFDGQGVMQGVVDFTNSDYEYEKNRRGGYRFERNGSTLANGQGGGADVIFRETYRTESAVRKRIRFQSSSLFSGWNERDPNSSVEQWTREGRQGSVAFPRLSGGKIDLSDRWDLTNELLDFVPFNETYQRHKKNLPGLSAPTRFNSDVLECPWLDRSGSACLNNFPRFISGIRAGC